MKRREVGRLSEAFARAAKENRAAFIAYLTAGDPSPEATVVLARALERAGADILELGVPFSDPIADGPVLQRAAERALSVGTRLETVFEIARRIRSESQMALVLFSYLNPLLRRGQRVAREARRAGFDGVLITDLPPEEARSLQPMFRSASPRHDLSRFADLDAFPDECGGPTLERFSLRRLAPRHDGRPARAAAGPRADGRAGAPRRERLARSRSALESRRATRCGPRPGSRTVWSSGRLS